MRALIALCLPVVVALVLGSMTVVQLLPSGSELLQNQKQQTDQALREQLRKRHQELSDRQQDEIRRKTEELPRRQSREELRRDTAIPPTKTR